MFKSIRVARADVDILDTVRMTGGYDTKPLNQNRIPNLDINGDDIAIFDIAIAAGNHGKHW